MYRAAAVVSVIANSTQTPLLLPQISGTSTFIEINYNYMYSLIVLTYCKVLLVLIPREILRLI